MESITPILIALCFNAVDLVSGIIGAIKNKNLKSSKLRDGIFKKVGFIFCYFLAWIVDTYGHTIGFDISIDILPIIIVYVCLTEAVSIIENICVINTDLLPENLKKLFHINDINKGGDN
jgi:toxin secretion/phage lysis holin